MWSDGLEMKWKNVKYSQSNELSELLESWEVVLSVFINFCNLSDLTTYSSICTFASRHYSVTQVFNQDPKDILGFWHKRGSVDPPLGLHVQVSHPWGFIITLWSLCFCWGFIICANRIISLKNKVSPHSQEVGFGWDKVDVIQKPPAAKHVP